MANAFPASFWSSDGNRCSEKIASRGTIPYSNSKSRNFHAFLTKRVSNKNTFADPSMKFIISISRFPIHITKGRFFPNKTSEGILLESDEGWAQLIETAAIKIHSPQKLDRKTRLEHQSPGNFKYMPMFLFGCPVLLSADARHMMNNSNFRIKLTSTVRCKLLHIITPNHLDKFSKLSLEHLRNLTNK